MSDLFILQAPLPELILRAAAAARRNDPRYPAVCERYQQKSRLNENVGSVRFELTIDGSLRHASVLQRVIISSSGDPLFITCKDRWSPSPFRTRPRPLALYIFDGHAV